MFKYVLIDDQSCYWMVLIINSNIIMIVCPANSFICDNTVCVPSIWECDSIDDCGDNSDEDHCNG